MNPTALPQQNPKPDAAACHWCGRLALYQERTGTGQAVGACRFHLGALRPYTDARNARSRAVVLDRLGSLSSHLRTAKGWAR